MMKALIYISILILSLLSCKAQKVEQEVIYGTFYKLNKDKHFSSSYTLVLNPDNTFQFIIKVQEGNPQCKGLWEIISNEYILLKCNEVVDVEETLTNAYMSIRENKLTIVSKNKLKYNNVVLKREK
jgi:hypothetical protein